MKILVAGGSECTRGQVVKLLLENINNDKMNWTAKYNDLEVICKGAFEWEGKLNETI